MKVMLFAFLAVGSLSGQQFKVADVQVTGLKRFTSAEVATFLKLEAGATVSKDDVAQACQRLADSGMFERCQYKYSHPAPTTIRLDLQVAEALADNEVRLTLPGVDDSKLWDWLKANEPLVKPMMPSSDDAIALYTGAVGRFMAASKSTEEITSAVETDLGTKRLTFIFRPKNLPAIVDVRFEGASAIAAEKLRDVMLKAAQGVPFTEFDYKQLLTLNATPLYERLGRLGVEFVNIRSEKTDAGVVVRANVQEGSAYQLASVKIEGLDDPDAATRRAGFPVGKLAEWDKVESAADLLTKELKNKGHLSARAKFDRKLNADGTALVTVSYSKGPVFTFGKLVLGGLGTALENRVRSEWTIKPGDPMNEGYLDEFLKQAFEMIGKEFTGVASGISVEPGTRVADVNITFRRGGSN